MGQLIKMPTPPYAKDAIDLFEEQSTGLGNELRAREQKEMLEHQASEVALMLDRLDSHMSGDREQAIAMMAEYTAILERVLDEIRRIRDIDEDFGGQQGRRPAIAAKALKFERSVAYLVGMFSVAISDNDLPSYNWKLIRRDLQVVLSLANEIQRQDELSLFKMAA